MKVEKCRLCKGKLIDTKLKFPPTPLANEYVSTLDKQDLFSLEVCMCKKCKHYQLNESISPERLFRHYLFVAGTSSVNVEHFKDYATYMVETFNIKPNSFVLDIASNDGVLLKHFKGMGMRILGIDPAKNIAEEANKNGIPTLSEFFTEEYADYILKEYGKFNLITANNVFAHVPDLADFARGIKKILAPSGIFSFEVSYFMDVCDNTLFDTIYHEHSSYHTITPLIPFFQYIGLKVIGFDWIDTHGGSIRVYVKHLNNYDRINTDVYRKFNLKLHSILAQEHYMNRKVSKLKRNINILGEKLREKLNNIKHQGKSIAIYGTPAKATTFMYALDIDESLIDFAVDDAKLKQGLFTPGKHIPIYSPNELYARNPDYVLILGWNFAKSIMANHKDYKGTWIVPLPKLKEYK